MGSRLSRQSGAEATGVLSRSKGSLRGRSCPEEPPRRLGPDCRLASLLRGSEKRPAGLRKSRPAAPYVRRVRWLREIQAALREHQHERAMQLLRLLRKVSQAQRRPRREGGETGPAPGMRAAPFVSSGVEAAASPSPGREAPLRQSQLGGRSERGCRSGQRDGNGAAEVLAGRGDGGGGAAGARPSEASPTRWVRAASKGVSDKEE